MIFLGGARPTSTPGVELMGALGASGGVKTLQTALKSLATFTGDNRYDPGTADGAIGVKTRTALVQALALMASSLPAAARAAATVLAISALTGKIDDQISAQSVTIAAGIQAYIATRSPPAPSPSPSGGGGGGLVPTGAAWYTTRNGKIVIVAGAGVLLLLLLKK